MPGNTKAIVRDVNAQPAPQLFDPSKDAYDYLLGDKGAMRAVLYDANGNPLLTQANPGYVDLIDRASRILGKISADDGAIAALGALAAAAITDPAQNASVIALLKGILKQLQGTGTGAAPVQLTGSNLEPAANFALSQDVVVTAGSSVVVYSNVDLSKYTHISGIFFMRNNIWPHKITVEWKNSRDSNVVRQDVVETGDTHKIFGPIPIITKNANIRVVNQDTVDRMIFTLEIYGHIRG